MFTWTNQQCNNPILKKLDRVLVNLKWNCELAGSEACFLSFGISNHSSMLVKIARMFKMKVSFKYFDFWADQPQFIEIITKTWGREVTGTHLV